MLSERVNSLLVTGVSVGVAATLIAFEIWPRNRKNSIVNDTNAQDDDRTISKAREGITDESDDRAIRLGFTMKDAKLQNPNKAMSETPAEVLKRLQQGNTRFWMGQAKRPEVSAFHRRALIMQQHPAVAILGCSDSRVPIEIVFDQGLGDIFVIRVAGNLLDTATQASVEYAVLHLGVKVVLVMGHEGCGAVQASRLPSDAIMAEPRSLGSLLMKMKENQNEDLLQKVHDKRSCDRIAVAANVNAQVQKLVEIPCIKSKIESKELIATGAFYEMSSGIVDLLE